MTFGRRLRLYILGVLMGCLMVVFFFQGRLSILTDWMPNNRVLLRLQQTDALYTDVALCELRCIDLDTAHVSALKADGDVQFNLSDTHKEPKTYVVDAVVKEKKVRMTFLAADSSSTLLGAKLVEDVVLCDCE